MEPVPRKSLPEIREFLMATGAKEDGPFNVFGKWFFDDPLTRAARPADTQTVRNEIEKWLKQEDLPRLRHSALRDPTDPRIWNRLADLVSISVVASGDERSEAIDHCLIGTLPRLFVAEIVC